MLCQIQRVGTYQVTFTPDAVCAGNKDLVRKLQTQVRTLTHRLQLLETENRRLERQICLLEMGEDDD